jgi:hypothetical protein
VFFKASNKCVCLALVIAAACSAQTTSSSSSSPSASASPLGLTPGNGAGSSSTFFESQMITYGALDQVTSRIADEVCAEAKSAHFVLFDSTSFVTVQQYRSFAKSVDLLTAMFNSFSGVEQPFAAVGGPSLQVAEGIFSTLSNVIGASTADKNTTFPVSDLAVAASLSRHLKANQTCTKDVTFPRIAMAEDPAAFSQNDQAITRTLRNLFDAQRAAAKKVQEEENRIKDRDLIMPGSSGTGTTATAQSAQLNSQFPNPLQVTVKDASGSPLSGVTVTFMAPTSGASGTFPNGTNTTTATTNATGVASTTITANGTSGTYSVAATVATVGSLQASFTLTNSSGPPATITNGGAAPTAPSAITLPTAPPRSVMGTDYLALTGATGLMNQFLSTYGLPVQATGVSPLSTVLLGLQLLSLLGRNNPDTYIIFWEASAAGGTQRDRKNLLTNIFTGDWISYSGGVVVSFGMIHAKDGQLMSPGLHRLLIPSSRIAAPPDKLKKAARQGTDIVLEQTR